MARARNIKHAFFMNDDLAEHNCALGRLFFIGLWTLADYKGDLEWRAAKIKAQLLPYDDADVKQLAINLDKSGFIRFYSDGDKIYLNIVNFEKHQNPHKNEREAGTDLPAFKESMRQVIDLNTLTINRDLSGLIPEQDETAPADCLILNPDSLSLKPEDCAKQPEAEPPEKQKRFVPPTVDQVIAYMQEIDWGNPAEATKFVNYHTTKGWVVGRTKMKDWQAALRYWRDNSAAPQVPQQGRFPHTFDNQVYEGGEL